MNITILAPYSRPHETAEAEGSGMNQYIRESALALAELGHSVTILIRKSRATDKNIEITKNVRLQFVDAGPAERMGRKGVYAALCQHINNFVAPLDTDLVIAHYWLSAPWIDQIRKDFYGRIIFCSHSFTFNPARTQTDHEAIIAESKLLSHVTWCANTLQEFLTMKALLPSDRLFLAYPGVDLPELETNAPIDAPQVLFLGRMNKAKGFDLFCSAILDEVDVNFLAVGRSETIHKRVPNLNIHPHVSLVKAYQLIQDSDVVVCPSRYEHFGFVPLIAALLNKKIVATNEGVIGDLQKFGYKNLFLSEPNSESLRKAIKLALSTKPVSTHSKIHKEFSWTHWSTKVLDTTTKLVTVYDGKYAQIEITPKQIDDGIVWYESVSMPGSVHVIPVNSDGEYGFITEVRFEYKGPIERILSGAIDVDELPEDAARRELEEETGLRTDKLELFYSNELNGTLCDRKYYYLAYNCETGGNTLVEKGEKILNLKYYSRDEIQKKILKNKYSPTSTLALLTLCGIFPVD